jgi:CRP-like cAMP-binding protein
MQSGNQAHHLSIDGSSPPVHRESAVGASKDIRLRKVARDSVLFWQDERQPQAIEIVDGAVRAVRLWSDGTRQILTFFWPGNVIQAAAFQRYTAEAVTHCVLRPRSHDQTSVSDPSGTDQALEASIRLLCATGKKNATRRMAWFLLQVQHHLPMDRRWPQARRFIIPRQDVADYLGMSMETACRTLAALRDRGVIDLPTRKTICFRDTPQLARIARSPKWDEVELANG